MFSFCRRCNSERIFFASTIQRKSKLLTKKSGLIVYKYLCLLNWRVHDRFRRVQCISAIVSRIRHVCDREPLVEIDSFHRFFVECSLHWFEIRFSLHLVADISNEDLPIHGHFLQENIEFQSKKEIIIYSIEVPFQSLPLADIDRGLHRYCVRIDLYPIFVVLVHRNIVSRVPIDFVVRCECALRQKFVHAIETARFYEFEVLDELHPDQLEFYIK